MGDFNSNARWDRAHLKDRNHSAMVQRLRALGLTSAYHAVRDVAQGEEREHTFFQYGKAGRGYHIDHCFVPDAWVGAIREVRIGGHAQWSRLSDHCPMLIDLDDSRLG